MLLFLGVFLLVIVVPGQDTALTIHNTLLSSTGTGLPAHGHAFCALTPERR